MTTNADAIPLDEFFSRQKQALFLATVEPTDNNEVVKVTPVVKGVGCTCGTSIKVAKSSVESVVPTGERHLCCGKNLLVVEIKFKDGASVPIEDFFEQQRRHAAKAQHVLHSLHQAHLATEYEAEQDVHHHPCTCQHNDVCPFRHEASFERCGSHCPGRSHMGSFSGDGICSMKHGHCGCKCDRRMRLETCHCGKCCGFH